MSTFHPALARGMWDAASNQAADKQHANDGSEMDLNARRRYYLQSELKSHNPFTQAWNNWDIIKVDLR